MPVTALSHSHDLRLPDWGPYTKKYTGISHLPDLTTGLRFDLSVFPGYYRRNVLVPNAKWESGFHPWEASPDLSYFSYRFELEWKDRVYADISYSALSPQARLVRSELVNHSEHPQNLVLHYAAYLNFPPVRTYSDEVVQACTVDLPGGAAWLDARNYDELVFATARPQDTLAYDGLWRGEVRDHGFVDGAGIGQGFGREAGDRVCYRLALTAAQPAGRLLVRYRTTQGAGFVGGGFLAGTMHLPAAADFTLAPLWQGDLPAGQHAFSLVSTGEGAVELDGFVWTPAELVDEVRFSPADWQPVPQILPGPLSNSLLLKYNDTPVFYGLAWSGEPWVLRELFNDELDRFMRYTVQEHVQRVLQGPGQGHFTNIFLRPIELPAGASRVLYGLACCGTQAEVTAALAGFPQDPGVLEGMYRQARAGAVRLEPSAAGDRYRFSQERMAATLLTNVVYPVYTRRSYIRHNTPGKWWDCLYTWDSGFIGLGLLELDVQRAIDCLNAYTTPEGDPQAAFMHHGSMVPVQHFLFHELWNRTQDRGLLEYFYPRLRQYYRFFAGRLGSSTMRRLPSQLLKTWDYFYNSGGWDDYPPQVAVHQNRLEAGVAPVASTAHGIRIARILQMAARAAGLPGDEAEYQADIDTWIDALQRYAWDEEAGYFGYVCHDAHGRPNGILRHTSGQNFNMGLDGSSPFIAAACTPQQSAIILEHLSSPRHLWTPIGLTTVDQSAAYYRADGYWNGAVWFPHQWFYWKALLDHNQPTFAAQIARTALDTWQREVDDSYHCFEHFIVQSGRGAGWHQFGGLSAPVLSWYGAYHRPARLTVGFDTLIQRQQFTDYNRRLDADLITHASAAQPHAVLVSLAAGPRYQARWNGQPVTGHERYPGVFEVTLPPAPGGGHLEIA